MSNRRAHVLEACMDDSTCTVFDGPAGRTELIQGRPLARVEAALHVTEHVMLARLRGRSSEARLAIAGGPSRSGSTLHRHLDIIPADCRAAFWDAGCEEVEYLAVVMPREVVDACAGAHGTTLDLRAGLGVTDHGLWATVDKIRHALARPDDLTPSYHGQLLRLLATELAARFSIPAVAPASPSRGGLSGRNARLLKQHLNEHFARPVPLAELAALVQLNRSHLVEAFRQTTGLPPHQFQTARRIERAMELLAEGALPLAEVALAVGYSDQSQFGVMFRRSVGCSPGRWRRQAKAAVARPTRNDRRAEAAERAVCSAHIVAT